MARPAAKDLTDRELEVMQIFWQQGRSHPPAEVRDRLAATGVDRAYVTVANLIRIVLDKGFLEQTNQERPFTYRAIFSSNRFNDVSHSLRISDLKVRRAVSRAARAPTAAQRTEATAAHVQRACLVARNT